MTSEGLFWMPDERIAAVLFIKAMIDPDLTREQKNRLADQWNEAQRKKKEKHHGIR